MRLNERTGELASPVPGHGTYRPEIDGLRAVAVLSVVLYHAGVPGISGGFVGVDVFFVLSGFLITGILRADIDAGRFSILTFYERRVRRIFPALLAMLAVSGLLALWLMLPFELASFGESLTATALFLSNFYFMRETGYFVAAAITKPLLHTWSLSIEEQFYVVFPIYLALMARHAPRWLPGVTAAALLASLVACVLMTHPQNDAAFFYTPARVWELLVGSMLALAPRRDPLRPLLAQALGLAGLVLIAVAVFGFDARTPFPGSAAVLPVAGTALVLFATARNVTLAGGLLSRPTPRFFGLISYSLYLWHWPILVFYRSWRIVPPAPWETVPLLLACVAVSTLSWRFIEQPFRTKSILPVRARLLTAGVVALLLTVTGGQILVRGDGLPGRVPPEVRALADIRSDEVDFSQCDSLPGGRPCRIGGPGSPGFVVWGDSHAGALMSAFEEAARRTGTRGLYLGAAGCVPLLGVNQNRWGFQTCAEGSDDILRAIADRPELATVILVSRWAYYAESRRFLHEAGHPVFIRDAETTRISEAENALVFARGLDRTITALLELGRRVVIVSQVPENEYDLPVAMARAEWLGKSVEFAPRFEDFAQRQARVNGLFHQAETRGDVTLLDLGAALCPAPSCPLIRSGAPLYRDSNHLTAQYARELAPLLEPALPPGP